MQVETHILQQELFKMMKEFHRICIENNLTYYMLGGTCLGAIRHKGFIPWDDDMDIGMPRKDYDTFCRIAKTVLPENLALRFYKNTKDSPFHFVKFVNENTTLIEPAYKNYVEGIYIDVFPLDNMIQYGVKNRIRSKCIKFFHALAMNHCYTKENRPLLNRVFEFFAKKISLRFSHSLLEKFMICENSSKEIGLLCNFLGAWGAKEYIPSSIFGRPTLYDFEDSKFFGPENAEAYLSSLYQNYMQLPPEKDRVGRHDFFYVNLNLPYRNYQKRIG